MDEATTLSASDLDSVTTRILGRRNSDPIAPSRQSAANWHQLRQKLGQRYHKCRLENFDAKTELQIAIVGELHDYCDQMDDNIEDGRSVCLFGPPGTGKDHLLTALMRVATMYGHNVEWLNGVELYSRVRDAMSTDERERDIAKELTRPAVLAISDPLPPSGALTEFQSAFLLRVIDRRYRDKKPTWVTLNVQNGKEAEDRMGVQVVDRLRDGALVCHCNWESYRKAAK